MLYNIPSMPQKELIEAGFTGKINYLHWAVICIIRNMQSSTWSDKKHIDNKVYVWVSYTKLQEELPIFGISLSRMKQVVKEACVMGFLEKSPENESDRKMYVCTTDLVDMVTSNRSVKKLTGQKTDSENEVDRSKNCTVIGQKIDGYNNTIYNNTIIDNNTLSISDLEQKFELFRKKYRGTKRGLSTELSVLKKHKDWKEVVGQLSSILDRQTKEREIRAAKGEFVPQWPNLQTYLNQRRWEEEAIYLENPQTSNRIPTQAKNNVMAGQIILNNG